MSGQYNDNDDIRIKGATDSTLVGNTGDRLKVITASDPYLNNDVQGRFRVSSPTSLLQGKFDWDISPLIFRTSTTTGGAVTHSIATATAALTTTTASGSQAILQTRRTFRYTAGHSYRVTLALTPQAKVSNTTKRWGVFDNLNGWFFEQTGTTLRVVQRSNTSGSVVDTQINQASWNLDKLDGTGSSGLTLDETKYNVFVIEYSWHGTGGIRFGIKGTGGPIYMHEISNFNTLTGPSTRTPNVPVRVEITNTGTSAGGTLTVGAVGLLDEAQTPLDSQIALGYAASSGITKKSVSGTEIPLLSLRSRTTFNGVTNQIPIIPISVSCITLAQVMLLRVRLNATLTGAAFASVSSVSAAEFDTAASAVSGGTLVYEIYVDGKGTTPLQLAEIFAEASLGLDVAGTTSDVLTITGQSTAGGTDTFTQIAWHEFQ